MSQAIVTLKKGEGRSLKAGGPWIYDNEVESIMGDFQDGDIVNIMFALEKPMSIFSSLSRQLR